MSDNKSYKDQLIESIDLSQLKIQKSGSPNTPDIKVDNKYFDHGGGAVSTWSGSNNKDDYPSELQDGSNYDLEDGILDSIVDKLTNKNPKDVGQVDPLRTDGAKTKNDDGTVPTINEDDEEECEDCLKNIYESLGISDKSLLALLEEDENDDGDIDSEVENILKEDDLVAEYTDFNENTTATIQRLIQEMKQQEQEFNEAISIDSLDDLNIMESESKDDKDKDDDGDEDDKDEDDDDDDDEDDDDEDD